MHTTIAASLAFSAFTAGAPPPVEPSSSAPPSSTTAAIVDDGADIAAPGVVGAAIGGMAGAVLGVAGLAAYAGYFNRVVELPANGDSAYLVLPIMTTLGAATGAFVETAVGPEDVSVATVATAGGAGLVAGTLGALGSYALGIYAGRITEATLDAIEPDETGWGHFSEAIIVAAGVGGAAYLVIGAAVPATAVALVE